MTTAAPPLADRLIDRLDAIVPPPSAWFFGLRIWLAMMIALYAAFWLQLDSASSAATCVAILAQPKRGQALSKAGYRFLGTIVGGVVAIVLMGLFNGDRVLLLVSFTVWLGLCVFVAQYLQDTRAYGAMLSGYTVGIIALANIDTPQNTFDVALGRVAAIAIGIVAITFINDALASPSTWRSLRPTLAKAYGATRAFVRDALMHGDPGDERTADLIQKIAAMRADTSAIGGELDDGRNRAAGARSAIAALYVMGAASRGFALACDRIRHPTPALAEARRLCLRAISGDIAEPGAERLARDDERLRDLVDAAIRDPTRALDETMALQRALDLHNAATFADDGLRALSDGHAPLRDVALPTHRDFQVALRGALRVAIAFAITASVFIFAGLPQASFALVQVSATAALSSVTPDPKKFAVGVLMGMPLAALFAGIILFVVLNGNQGFPLLAIAMAPVVFFGCFLSLNPKTFTVGFISLVFTPVLLSPTNPQSYNPQTFLMNAYLVVAASVILFLVVRLVLPISNSRHRFYALEEARRDTADALIGEGGDATTRTSLNADRLFQFSQWNSGSGTVRRASLAHAFALSRLESSAARAHAQMRLLWCADGLRASIRSGREALARGNAWGLEDAARAMLTAGRQQDRDTRLRIARAATDLATASQVIRRHGRFFRRLALPSS
ncbi:FUSC family protein [Methylobacterium haplocladii]|uniref:Membrane protein n=1 Tax=Methylobacterium haplocladii TaxID=1176176 RepID=A0A512IRH5_9HYPH|nr:FUSC family protein [Methylobacterium haplocladii]GEP00310.1 membrane protein [Methylobacterium haplocladii]GJD86081.1 p-hydroxybenzoic acid efflux pump subunit AaeB [Methylobacterium haplocladii]GLS59800.1 membrane protein [Methylobacterium haplocladii]